MAYHGIAASLLRYGIIFWANSPDFQQVFKAQKRCIRSMFRICTTDSCKPYFVQHRILTLPSIYILEIALFVKKNPQLFPRLSDTVVRNRRDNTRLRIHGSKTELMRKSIFCMGPNIYNKLPTELKTLNIMLFKKRLKNILVNKCYYNVKDYLNDSF